MFHCDATGLLHILRTQSLRIFGILLVLGELGFPRGIYNFFGLLASPGGRAAFIFFIATLCLSSGLSGDRTAISSILLIVAGAFGMA